MSDNTLSSFKRTMHSRHLVMLSLGGVIGNGLFLSSGDTIQQAGPVGAIIAYLIVAFGVYMIMMCLGELAVHMPESGAFSRYATEYINPATGYVVGWLYWLTWAVALASEFTGIGLLMGKWFPAVPVWYWCVASIVLVFVLNMFAVRIFAEAEFWLSLVKVLTIVVFLVLGGLAIFGMAPAQHEAAPMFHNLVANGVFPHGVLPILMIMLTVSYAFSGTELIGVAAGETVDPDKNLPVAIKTTLWRLIIFFVGTIIIIGALLPSDLASAKQSPFVIVLERMGIPYADDIINLVIITALLSAANSGLYAASRMLWTLADQKTLPSFLGRLSSNGVPRNALILTMLGGLLSLLSSYYAADSLYLFLVSVSGFAVVVVWLVIGWSHLNFRRQYQAGGGNMADLAYRAPFFPWVSIISIVFCVACIAGIAFDPQQRIALYCGLGFTVLCYLAYLLTGRNQTEAEINTSLSEVES
ncbi:amino acid permease [Gynuella sunshinyii]|nr:amino acid permease [Gynuella sunshinyii]